MEAIKKGLLKTGIFCYLQPIQLTMLQWTRCDAFYAYKFIYKKMMQMFVKNIAQELTDQCSLGVTLHHSMIEHIYEKHPIWSIVRCKDKQRYMKGEVK